MQRNLLLCSVQEEEGKGNVEFHLYLSLVLTFAFLCKVSLAFLVIAALIRVATFFVLAATVVGLLLATRLLLAATVRVTTVFLFLATILVLGLGAVLLLAALSLAALLLLLATILDTLA